VVPHQVVAAGIKSGLASEKCEVKR